MQDKVTFEWAKAKKGSQFPECGMNLCRKKAIPTIAPAAESSQFPECGMNLCRAAARKEIESGPVVSQFPECGMNLCRSSLEDADFPGLPECLNSLNAG